MSEYVTVYRKGSALTLYPHVAARFGLRNGQSLPEHDNDATFWALIGANAEEGLRLIREEETPS